MKRYYDLTSEELVALTEKEIDLLVDLEIAHEGIIPEVPPTEFSLEKVDIKKDCIAYEAKGVLFQKEDEAKLFMGMKTLDSSYDYNIGSEYRYLKGERYFDQTGIIEKRFYNRDDLSRIKDILSSNEAKKQEYNKQKELYDKYINCRNKVMNQVYEHIWAAQQKNREIEAAKNNYLKYLELANNDDSIAQKFFINAYKEKTDIIKIVLGEAFVVTGDIDVT